MIECLSMIRAAEKNGKFLYQPIGRRNKYKNLRMRKVVKPIASVELIYSLEQICQM